MDICHEIDIVRRELAEVRRARFHAGELQRQVAAVSTPSNTARLRELFESHDVPLHVQSAAIQDCEGRLPAHCDTVIRSLKSSYPKRSRSTPTPESVLREVTQIGPQLIQRHAMNLARGVHQSAAELRAEIAAGR